MKTYTLYDHVSPSGKHYIGQTCQKVERHGGKDGHNYFKRNKQGDYNQPVFAAAIKKYGWNSFRHEILFHGCSKELADKLEKAFIAYGKNLGMSYNCAPGGKGGSRKRFTDEELREHDKQRKAAYYEAHKEETKAYKHQWYKEHYDKEKERLNRQKGVASLTEEQRKEMGKRDRENRREQRLAYSKQYYVEHKEYFLQKAREYRKTNKEQSICQLKHE